MATVNVPLVAFIIPSVVYPLNLRLIRPFLCPRDLPYHLEGHNKRYYHEDIGDALRNPSVPASGNKMNEKTNTREKKTNLQPGDLNQYIRLTTVSIWLVLGAFLVFVLGMVVWGFTGNLTVSVKAVAVGHDSIISLYIPEDQLSRIKDDNELVINGKSFTLGDVHESNQSQRAGDVLDEYQLSLADLSDSQKVISVDRDLSGYDGSYGATIVLERIKPFEFLFGGN